MQADEHFPTPIQSAANLRRRAVIVFVAFVALSTAVHFTLGPGLTKLSPHWAASNLPDQALSIITLSHKEQPQALPSPTPSPTPPPIPLPRTKRDLALLKYREIGSDVRLRMDVRPPARRASTIILEHAAPLRPQDKSKDADVVVAMPEPTPQASQPPGSARADTAGKQDELSGSIVWGDDNPPRLLRQAPLAIEDHATGTVRIEVEIGPDGQIISARVVQSSGDASVDQAALDAARNSTFAPATLNGMPVHGTKTLDYAPGAQST
jgi:TonB family protein